MPNIAYWAIIGTIYLLILTYQDYKHKRWVDDRLNFFMMGVTLSLFSHFSRPWWYSIALIALVFGLYFFFMWKKPLGEADVKTIIWQFWGFAIIGYAELIFYGGALLILSSLYAFLWAKIVKNKVPVPFYPVLLLTFFTTCFLFGIYFISF